MTAENQDPTAYIRSYCQQELGKLEQKNLRRSLPSPHFRADSDGVLNFATNNYLGLANDPRLAEAAQKALKRWGMGAEASRLVTGNKLPHVELEEVLADFKGRERALVFSSGYAANVGVLTALAGPRDRVFADRLSHASLIDGCRQAHAQLRLFRHRDLDHLEEMLNDVPERAKAFIVTDGVFSMDGQLAPLPALVEMAEQYGALLVVDDAHGTGVVGPDGRGSPAYFGVSDRIPIQIGTLSKALGAQGGYVVGIRELIDLLINKARSFIYSTGIAPPVVAAARRAIEIVRDDDTRRQQLQDHVAFLRERLRDLGYDIIGEAPAPLLAIKIGAPDPALRLADFLRDRGILAPAIRPPTVPEGTSRIRLAPMATHTREDLERLCSAFPPASDIIDS